MAKTIHVDIVSAEGEIFAGEAEMVFVPAKEGELGITPRHAPLLSLIKAGEVRVRTAEGDQSVFVSGGALEIQPNRVTILADTAVRAKDDGRGIGRQAGARKSAVQQHRQDGPGALAQPLPPSEPLRPREDPQDPELTRFAN
jgi:F-type H+-transporting ATPase subunit epsilon